MICLSLPLCAFRRCVKKELLRPGFILSIKLFYPCIVLFVTRFMVFSWLRILDCTLY